MQDAFKDAISFAALRLLFGACREFEGRVCLEHETIFVSNVRSAVKYLCNDDHFQSISTSDKALARGWLGNLNTLYERMQEVSKARARAGSVTLRVAARCPSNRIVAVHCGMACTGSLFCHDCS